MYGLWLWLMTLSFVEMGSGWKINSFGFQGLSPPYFTSKVVCTVYNFIQKCLTQKGRKSCADFIFSYLKRNINKSCTYWSIIFAIFWQWSQEVVVFSRRSFMSCYRFSEGFCKDHLMVYFHFKRRFESLCSTICILHSSIKSPD